MIDHAVWPSNSGNPLIGEKLIDWPVIGFYELSMNVDVSEEEF